MSSPDSFTLELDVTPIPTIDAVSEARLSFPTPEPGRISPDSTQTVQVDLDPGTQVERGEDDEGGESVGEGATPAGTTKEGGSEVTSESGSRISRGGAGGPPSYCHCNTVSHEYMSVVIISAIVIVTSPPFQPECPRSLLRLQLR